MAQLKQMNRVRRRHRSAEQWAQLIREQAASGLAVAAFCRERDVCVSGFYNWRKKLAATASCSDAEADAASFVRLHATAGATETVSAHLPDGTEVRVPASRLADLVAALRRSSADLAGGGSC